MKYLVALAIGGTMDNPLREYIDLQIIEANSPREAEKEYNKKNKCNYFYGHCLGVTNEEVNIKNI